MNDFTKDELEGMVLCISHGSWAYKADKKTVIYKLQSLIDNYCDHSGNIAPHEWKTCNDCGMPFTD